MSGCGGRIAQISLSSDGVPKPAVSSGRVTTLGLKGDVQRDREHHGGPECALCLFALGRIRSLQVEGHPITPRSIGENPTLKEIDCNINGSFRDRDYVRVSQKRHPGDSRVYARELREGALASGDAAQILSDREALALIGAR